MPARTNSFLAEGGGQGRRPSLNELPPTERRRWGERLASVHPDMVKLVECAFQNSVKPFVIDEGLRSLDKQFITYYRSYNYAPNDRGVWNPPPEKPYTKTIVSGNHLGGYAVDLNSWPRTEKSSDLFYIMDAMRQCSLTFHIPIRLGHEFRGFRDSYHFELVNKPDPAIWILGAAASNSLLFQRVEWTPFDEPIRHGLLNQKETSWRLLENNRLLERQAEDLLDPRAAQARRFLLAEVPTNPDNPRSDRVRADENPLNRNGASRQSEEELFKRFERGRQVELPARNDYDGEFSNVG
ncbi:hypothetical protein GOC67_12625 [Sinorhizobium medicae]|nr:hypothetical protein [Sinorhizobium medicae]MDX1174500.1 hypothetical protein [Sinorhizobium medicae]